jgi:hypothetical protein
MPRHACIVPRVWFRPLLLIVLPFAEAVCPARLDVLP